MLKKNVATNTIANKEKIKPYKFVITNGLFVDDLDNGLKSLIKIIKPSRASLSYERME